LPVEVSIWNTHLKNAAGAVTGILAIVADNTERKRLEEQFRQSQKMEAVGRLAGGVAHDFNNLLTVITGYCQMLLERLSPADPLAGDMQQVMKAAERATTLTKQLLAFSRQQIVQPKVVDLSGLVADMDHILKRLVGEDIDVVIRGRNDGCRVRIDPGQLEQVIVNLVVNAKDAMPGGGKVSIETNVVDISARGSPHAALLPGPYVTLTVRDTGVGIPEDVRAHLFEPFFTTKERGRGTGLGLSTSYGIVKQNRGEILVSSQTGTGSAFEIYLPRVEDPPDIEVVPQVERRIDRGTETILVAEDEEGVRRVVVEMLQQQGYHVLAACGGPEALELYNSLDERVHLLITDVVMPKMSGPELADRLRGKQPSLRVLFVSGYTDSDIVHHGVLNVGTHFLQKPFTPDSLASKVREVLQK
jgi:signal transduction histidine kinase/CheY-like chemotaxis protein